MSVQGCMHAQQQIEINEIKKNGYHGWEHSEISQMLNQHKSSHKFPIQLYAGPEGQERN